ncbi:MAG: nitroreductase family protein [Desulfuromusa sp.]|jgi:nitroreductase|nr:nitroreductase family protein [Desulfuromusa sp.]
MKFIELAEKRRSIRGYKPDPVPEEQLNEILQAGNLAPTAKNLQPFHFIVVRDPAKLDELAVAYPAPFFRQAPVAIVICTEPAEGWTRDRYDGKNYCEVDAAIAIDHMTLAAADIGLGTCWIGAFDPARVTDAMGLPEGIHPIAMLPVGYPNEAGREKSRKPLKELVRYDCW